MLQQIFTEPTRVQKEIEGLEQVLEETVALRETCRKVKMSLLRNCGASTSAGLCSWARVRYTIQIWLVLKMMQPLSGYTAVVLYSTSIFDDKSNPNSVLYATVMVGVANTTAVIFFSFLVDRTLAARMSRSRPALPALGRHLRHLRSQHLRRRLTPDRCSRRNSNSVSDRWRECWWCCLSWRIHVHWVRYHGCSWERYSPPKE